MIKGKDFWDFEFQFHIMLMNKGDAGAVFRYSDEINYYYVTFNHE